VEFGIFIKTIQKHIKGLNQVKFTKDLFISANYKLTMITDESIKNWIKGQSSGYQKLYKDEILSEGNVFDDDKFINFLKNRTHTTWKVIQSDFKILSNVYNGLIIDVYTNDVDEFFQSILKQFKEFTGVPYNNSIKQNIPFSEEYKIINTENKHSCTLSIDKLTFYNLTNNYKKKELIKYINNSDLDQELRNDLHCYSEDIFSLYDNIIIDNLLSLEQNSKFLAFSLHSSFQCDRIISILNEYYKDVEFVVFFIDNESYMENNCRLYIKENKKLVHLNKYTVIFFNIEACFGHGCEVCKNINSYCIMLKTPHIGNNPNQIILEMQSQQNTDIAVKTIEFYNNTFTENKLFYKPKFENILNICINKLIQNIKIYNNSYDYRADVEVDKYSDEENQKIITEIKSIYNQEFSLISFYFKYKIESEINGKIYTMLLKTEYSNIAFFLHSYYTNGDIEHINKACDILNNFYLKSKSIIKKIILLILLAELTDSNFFNIDPLILCHKSIYSFLINFQNYNILNYLQYELDTYICSLGKEILFNGDYNVFASSFHEGVDHLLLQYEKHLSVLENNKKLFVNKERQIILLYRQRAVVWEFLGDSSLKANDRKEYYIKWQEDSKNAISLSKNKKVDKEILGCAYLNYASSLTRLSVYKNKIKEQKNMLQDCLENLEMSEKYLNDISANRYLGYMYLHKGDCYEAYFRIDKNIEYCKNIKEASIKANDIFKNTNDDVGKAWSCRLLAKSEFYLTDVNKLSNNFENTYIKVKEALKLFGKTKNANGITSCTRDIYEYFDFLDINNQTNNRIFDLYRKLIENELQAINEVFEMFSIGNEDINNLQFSISELFIEKL